MVAETGAGRPVITKEELDFMCGHPDIMTHLQYRRAPPIDETIRTSRANVESVRKLVQSRGGLKEAEYNEQLQALGRQISKALIAHYLNQTINQTNLQPRKR